MSTRMKSSMRVFAFLLVLLAYSSCGNEDDIIAPSEPSLVPVSDSIKAQHAFPLHADTLRILALGNSFTNDAVAYLRTLTKNMSIDLNRLCIYSSQIGGSGLQTWTDKVLSEDSITIYQMAGNLTMTSRGKSRDILNQDWDIIVITQVSNKSYSWWSFAILPDYLHLIDTYCPNKNVCIAYQLPWSHTPDEMPWVLDGNIDCWKNIDHYYYVNTLIPTGTAIQLARNTSLNDSLYLTRDNWHLNMGLARYIASCTWCEALLRPVFNEGIVGNKARPKGDYSDEDILLAQKCAQQAVANPYVYN